MTNQLPDEPAGVPQVRELVRANNMRFEDVFWAMCPEAFLNDNGDNMEELEAAESALLDDVARFCGQYVAESCLMSERDPHADLDKFLQTLRSAFDDELRTNY